MIEATDIEKKSLEAHVELCAERYNALNTRIENVDQKISELSDMICKVHGIVEKMAEKRNDQIIGWGVGVITFLISTSGYLILHYVIK